jgi:hypothetical protein
MKNVSRWIAIAIAAAVLAVSLVGWSPRVTAGSYLQLVADSEAPKTHG